LEIIFPSLRNAIIFLIIRFFQIYLQRAGKNLIDFLFLKFCIIRVIILLI
jgi:hypothetical protein